MTLKFAASPTATKRIELTTRQRQILALVAAGCSNKVIAHRLKIGEGTVKWHISRLLQIHGAPNRAALVTRALRRRSAR